jgi:hypothetical protein
LEIRKKSFHPLHNKILSLVSHGVMKAASIGETIRIPRYMVFSAMMTAFMTLETTKKDI